MEETNCPIPSMIKKEFDKHEAYINCKSILVPKCFLNLYRNSSKESSGNLKSKDIKMLSLKNIESKIRDGSDLDKDVFSSWGGKRVFYELKKKKKLKFPKKVKKKNYEILSKINKCDNGHFIESFIWDNVESVFRKGGLERMADKNHSKGISKLISRERKSVIKFMVSNIVKFKRNLRNDFLKESKNEGDILKEFLRESNIRIFGRFKDRLIDFFERWENLKKRIISTEYKFSVDMETLM